MSGRSVLLLAAALRRWLALQEYRRQAAERIADLESLGLAYEANELRGTLCLT